MSFGKKNSLRSYQRLRLPAHQHRLLRIEALENRLLLSATTHNPPEVSALRNIGGVPSHVIAKHEETGAPVYRGDGRWYLSGNDDFSRIYTTNNANSSDTVNADQLVNGGGLNLNLDGSGVVVGIWDGGQVRDSHQELTGRVTRIDENGPDPDPDPADHATHVAGTIGATGVDPDARGMANQVAFRSRDFFNDKTELAADATLLALSNHSYSFIRGWKEGNFTGCGYGEYWFEDRSQATEDRGFGKYNTGTQQLDDVMTDNPHFLSIWSAGNDRDNTYNDIFNDGLYITLLSQDPGGFRKNCTNGLQGWFGTDWYLVQAAGNAATTAPARDGGVSGYDTLPQDQTAKNTLVVGAIKDITVDPYSDSDVVMTAFSSWGPTDDGRIKPDVVANGFEVHSAVAYVPSTDPNETPVPSDSSYDGDPTNLGDLKVWNGTSMAAPSVTGTAALLVEHYRNLFGDGNPNTNSYPNLFDDDNPRSATMRGLLIHTAFDVTNAAANVGPDYSTGWGLVDAAAAAEFLTGAKGGTGHTTELFERTYDGNEWTHSLRTDGGDPLRITIAWTDPAPTTLPGSGLDDSTSVLVNDLDLWITNSSGTVFYRAWNLDPAELSARREEYQCAA